MLTIPSGWECRYFQPELPPWLAVEKLHERLGVSASSVLEWDTYVLVPGVSVNVKLRAAAPATVKVKELIEREDDGFELWQTSVDAQLPVDRETWELVGRAASLDLDTARLGATSHHGEALDVLRDSAAASARFVDVVKRRTSFPSESASVEVAEVSVAHVDLESVAFESPDLGAARSLRSRVVEDDLGAPENYVAVCRRILGGSA